MTAYRFSGPCIVGLAILAVGPRQAQANVYAAHLEPGATSWNFVQSGPLTLSYRLNTSATSVTVEIYRASAPGTVIKSIPGPTAYGLNQVVWDGTDANGQAVAGATDYKFRVIATDAVPKAVWTNITPTSGGNEIGSAQYFAPVGIAINRDPTSPHFGRIYISSSSPSPSSNPGATAAGDGLFLLNSDMTFRNGSAAGAAAAANGQLTTNVASSNSPFKISINIHNPDEIVMGDFSDGFENVWIFNATGSTVSRILNSTTTGPTGSAGYTHGNAISVALTGTGANRKLWVIDEDKDVGETRTSGGFDVIRFDVGETVSNFLDPGTEVINGGSAAFGPAFFTARDMKFGRVNGTSRLYVSCQRSLNNAGELAIACFTLDANGVIDGLLWSKDNPTMTAETGTTPVWTLTGPIAVDEARGRGAAGIEGANSANNNRAGRVAIFDTETGAVLASFDSGISATGSRTMRGMDFDAAGNLYTANQSDEHVRMWSPPGESNSYTTAYHGQLEVCNSPVPIINAQSDGGTFCAGQPLSLSVSAEGHGTPLSYVWKKGNDVVGTNSPTLDVPAAQVSDTGVYTVTVIGCGTTVSAPMPVTVIGQGSIAQHPAPLGRFSGESAVFTVAAPGKGTLSYQWKQTLGNQTVPVGVDSATLVIPEVSLSLNGALYFVEITDPACNLVMTSNTAVLNVLARPCPLRFADTDADGDVDQADYSDFQLCINDEGQPYPDRCRCLDRAEPAGTINLADLAVFEQCASGPAVPAAAVCGGTVLFSDDFDTPASSSSPNWTVRSSGSDYTLTFGFDYGAAGIPPAPNSQGTTRGLYVSVNDVDDPPAAP
ncbi:MAG: hypothetical protein HRF43_09650 [Phycisphaerae bacterium]|jgi:hypothetical protein